MMIDSRSKFEQELGVVDRVIDRNATLPEQVFRHEPVAFHVIEFDHLWSEEFFTVAQRMSAAAGDSYFSLAVLRPDPVDYYYAHFGRFPLLQFRNGEAAADYVAALHADPGGSSADAIAYNSEVVVVYPPSARWSIYFDRNQEIGIVAIMEHELVKTIQAIPHAVKFFTISDAVGALLAPLYRGAVPAEFEAALLRNYDVRRKVQTSVIGHDPRSAR